jgi:hypothetical protein
MRLGQNPLRRQRRRQPARISVVTVSHIPFLAGYFAQSLDVLKLMLASLRANTDAPYDLLVMDNASCREVRDFLLEQHGRGVIQYLFLSGENLGKLWEVMFGAAQGEYIAYADGDTYFHPGWLSASLQVLETFPNVGLVSGLPCRHRSRSYNSNTFSWARETPGVELEEGDLLPQAWIADYSEGIGLEVDEYVARHKEKADCRLRYRNVTAYTGTCTNQFLGRRRVLQAHAPAPSEWVMHQDSALHASLNDAGYLMLATDGLYVHHLGNVLNARWREVAASHGLGQASPVLRAHERPASGLAQTSLGRRAALKLYDFLFRVLYDRVG